MSPPPPQPSAESGPPPLGWELCPPPPPQVCVCGPGPAECVPVMADWTSGLHASVATRSRRRRAGGRSETPEPPPLRRTATTVVGVRHARTGSDGAHAREPRQSRGSAARRRSSATYTHTYMHTYIHARETHLAAPASQRRCGNRTAAAADPPPSRPAGTVPRPPYRPPAAPRIPVPHARHGYCAHRQHRFQRRNGGTGAAARASRGQSSPANRVGFCWARVKREGGGTGRVRSFAGDRYARIYSTHRCDVMRFPPVLGGLFTPFICFCFFFSFPRQRESGGRRGTCLGLGLGR